MDNKLFEIIKNATGAKDIEKIEVIQSLWSGYGEIARYRLKGCERETVVLKQVQLPKDISHPRGWNTSNSHERKVKSYVVEVNWYKEWANSAMIAHQFHPALR